MKFSAIILVPLLAAVSAAQAPSIEIEAGERWNKQEAQDLFQCSVNMLNGFDRDITGNQASCTMLKCLQNYSVTYNRGGLYARASQALSVLCVVA